MLNLLDPSLASLFKVSSGFSLNGSTYSIDSTLAFANLKSTEYYLEVLLMALAYICGLAMIFRGLAMYKAFGENINQATRPGEVAGPAVYIVVGTLMFYLPSTFNAVLYTIFGTTTVTDLTYQGSGSSTNWDNIYLLITRYSHLIGLISFFRGLTLISKAGDHGVQPGSITRGIIHLIAGVMLYNIGGTVDAFQYTFGITVSSG